MSKHREPCRVWHARVQWVIGFLCVSKLFAFGLILLSGRRGGRCGAGSCFARAGVHLHGVGASVEFIAVGVWGCAPPAWRCGVVFGRRVCGPAAGGIWGSAWGDGLCLPVVCICALYWLLILHCSREIGACVLCGSVSYPVRSAWLPFSVKHTYRTSRQRHHDL